MKPEKIPSIQTAKVAIYVFMYALKASPASKDVRKLVCSFIYAKRNSTNVEVAMNAVLTPITNA